MRFTYTEPVSHQQASYRYLSKKDENIVQKILKGFLFLSLTISVWSIGLVVMNSWAAWGSMEAPSPAVDAHVQGIASFAKTSPVVSIPAGWFLMGTNRQDLKRHSLETQYDDTEFPQRRIWLDAYQIDQY